MEFQKNRSLKELSTFGIGGPARFFVEVTSYEQLGEVVAYCYEQDLNYIIIGRGSNLLFDDRGFNGLVVLNRICFCTFNENLVHVGAGYNFSLLGVQTARRALGGLEFACGIPGTVGGAVYMNAGANGAQVSDLLLEVEYFSEEGKMQRLKKNEMTFCYRFSQFQKQKGAIAAATFQLHPSQSAREKQIAIIHRRKSTQPYTDKSAGCVFRNPQGASAGALIEECGLKGKSIGGAEVSTVHANFIVNKGNATAKEVQELAALVKQIVKEKKQIDLEWEVHFLSYESTP